MYPEKNSPLNNPYAQFFNPANDPFGTDGMDGSDSLSGVSISNRMADILGYSDLTNNLNQNATEGSGLAGSAFMPEGNQYKALLASNFPETMQVLVGSVRQIITVSMIGA